MEAETSWKSGPCICHHPSRDAPIAIDDDRFFLNWNLLILISACYELSNELAYNNVMSSALRCYMCWRPRLGVERRTDFGD